MLCSDLCSAACSVRTAHLSQAHAHQLFGWLEHTRFCGRRFCDHESQRISYRHVSRVHESLSARRSIFVHVRLGPAAAGLGNSCHNELSSQVSSKSVVHLKVLLMPPMEGRPPGPFLTVSPPRPPGLRRLQWKPHAYSGARTLTTKSLWSKSAGPIRKCS